MRKPGAAIAYAFFAALAALAVMIAIAYAGNLKLISMIGANQKSFEKNVYEQSTSLNRVVFAVSDLLLQAGSGRGGAGFGRLLDLGQACLNHARFSQYIESAFLAGILGDDPLFLAERASKSNELYRARLDEMTGLLDGAYGLGETRQGEEALGKFLKASAAFMGELKDRSGLFLQVEAAFHAASRKNLASLGARIRLNLVEFSLITVLLAAISILFFRSRLSIELELKARRESLSRLVAARTEELGATNASLQAALEEKELLIKEVYHRVKNNLAIVASLITLQQSEARPENLDEAFEKLSGRINAISLIHEKLYRSKDLSNIAFADYVAELCQALIHSLSGNPDAISLELASEDAVFPADTLVPLGLIITELVTNSLKHAFKGRARGKLAVSLARTADGFVLEVRDDGTPPADRRTILESKSLGSMLVASLVGQIKGSLDLDLSRGTAVIIRFPYDRGAAA
jgi:two-component sensor histidine kinase